MALSSGAVHVALLERGLEPLEVTTRKSVFSLEITKKKVPRSDVMNFTRQLAVFMKAGIPIMEALEVIVEETSNKLMRAVLRDVYDSLRAGDTFAAAAAAHPEAFPNFYVGILESAELTGNLDAVLNQLADYIERDQVARSRIKAALIYPVGRGRHVGGHGLGLDGLRSPAIYGFLQVSGCQIAAGDAHHDVDIGFHIARVVRRVRRRGPYRGHGSCGCAKTLVVARNSTHSC